MGEQAMRAGYITCCKATWFISVYIGASPTILNIFWSKATLELYSRLGFPNRDFPNFSSQPKTWQPLSMKYRKCKTVTCTWTQLTSQTHCTRGYILWELLHIINSGTWLIRKKYYDCVEKCLHTTWDSFAIFCIFLLSWISEINLLAKWGCLVIMLLLIIVHSYNKSACKNIH